MSQPPADSTFNPQGASSVQGLTLNISTRFTAAALFIIALAPRLPGLARFLTSDENTNIFFAGSDVIVAFLRGDFRGTYWHFYPGVTMSWLDALGMGGQYLLERLAGQPLPPFTEYIYGPILSLVVANRLPYVLLTAAAVPAIYGLARQLLPERVALLGALFLAFDPFFLAHSRVAHGDAPLAVFMALSALTFFIYLRCVSEWANQRMGESANGRMGESANEEVSFSSPALAFWGFILPPSAFYLIASAIFGSLAALTKAPGQFMPLFVVGMSLIYAGQEIWQRKAGTVTPSAQRRQILSFGLYPLSFWLAVIAAWGVVSLLVFVLLWPAMWVAPLETIQRMWSQTFIKVDEGHLVYFFGQPTLNPGPWFYPYVIPFRMTPISLVGVILSLLWLILGVKSSFRSQKSEVRSQKSEVRINSFLWLFVISLLLFGTLSPKKQDRYLLPLFPFLDLLAAFGWAGLIDLTRQAIQRKKIPLLPTPYLLLPTSYCLLLLFHLLPTFTYYPYYLAYFNPLMGGPARAAQTTLMGWGEGMEQAAAYLNTKPNAGRLYVASTPSPTFLPDVVGTGENFYTNDIAFRADYVILYLAQMQRLAPSPEIVRYFQARPPEKVITIQGVEYAKIYPGPKLILSDIPAGAVPANIGLGDILRLAGYKIQLAADMQNGTTLQSSSQRPPMGSPPTLLLYWHALAPVTTNYTISVRARAPGERLLAQQDSWPVAGLLPTSQWRQGDYVADAHTLQIPQADLAAVDHFEVVVYNAETGQTLGPPITLSLSHE